MGGNGGEMGGNGGKWGGNGELRDIANKYLVGNVEKMCGIRRKWEGNRDNLGQS